MKRYPAIVASLLYLAAGSLWILTSDLAAGYLAGRLGGATLEELQRYKGLLYVFLTSVLVYILVRGATIASRRYAAEMEERVAERTREIEAVRRRLENLNAKLTRRNYDLELSNRDLESFSYSVSHDLRAPLRAVNGFSEILRKHHAAELSTEARHYLTNVIVSATRMNRLIDDLLRYARLGRRSIAPEPIALLPIVRQICQEFDQELASIGGSVVLPDNDEIVLAEESLVAQIVSNLIENAVRYRSPDRELVVSIAIERHEERVHLSVRDNGQGIPPVHQERIFALFQRLQNDDAGTGLGLALGRRAAEAIEGRLTVESLAGEGSTFTLSLPGGGAK